MDKENPFIAKTLDDRERVSKLFFPPKQNELIEKMDFAIAYPMNHGRMTMRGLLIEAKQLLESREVDEDTANVIDNLVGLQECLEAGEDWCSAAIIAGAIELLQSKRILK